MLLAVQKFIPVLNSEAGLSLTPENWKKAKVQSVSYSLELLLYKPGVESLKNITDLGSYLGWSGSLVLNASSFVANKEGDYPIKSPYDGSQMKLTALDLIQLIVHLKPDLAILPKKILQNYPSLWDHWDDAITPFIYAEDLSHQKITRAHGVYLDESTLGELDNWLHLKPYLIGAFDRKVLHDLHLKEVRFIESDEPASVALQGKVYSRAGDIDLTLSDTSMRFETIDSDCTCSTCSGQLTQAYLHHLLQHTPLLCKRLLIEHNVFWINNFS